MNKKNWIVAVLQQKKQKITSTRQVISDWLVAHKGLFCAADILASEKTLDKVSVYRTLDLLERVDIIHPVLKKGDAQYYEIHSEDHHHHIVCNECDEDTCVPCNIEEKPIKGFKNIHHAVVLTGVCNSCN